MTKRETIIKLLQTFSNGDTAFVKKVLKPDYIQHNLEYGTGAQALIDEIEHIAHSTTKVSVHTARTIEEGDFVVAHSVYTFGTKEYVVIDVFRFEGDKVAEHWDNMIPMQKPNPSGRTQVDGTTTIKHHGHTAANKKIVHTFQELLSKGDFPHAVAYLDPHYVQHNPQAGDGIAGVQQAIVAAAKLNRSLQFGKIHHVIGEGDLVFISSEGVVGTTPVAIYDLFRVDNGKLVEHWDVIAPIATPANGHAKNNPHGKW